MWSLFVCLLFLSFCFECASEWEAHHRVFIYKREKKWIAGDNAINTFQSTASWPPLNAFKGERKMLLNYSTNTIVCHSFGSNVLFLMCNVLYCCCLLFGHFIFTLWFFQLFISFSLLCNWDHKHNHHKSI